MVLSQKDIKKVVQGYFKDKPVTSVYLFGSYARGEATEDSDVDLLIEINDKPKRLSLFDVLRLELEISETLHKKVDLVESKLLFPKIREQVNLEKIKLFSC